MRLEIEGELSAVQGSVLHAVDLFGYDGMKVTLDKETKAGAVYNFSHTVYGDIGNIKLSVLPKGRTELYNIPPLAPDKKWLVEYLSKLPRMKLGDLLFKLVNIYSWQIQQGIFDLSGEELLLLGFKEKTTDWGWKKFRLGKLSDQKAAEKELEKWRQTIRDQREKLLNEITDTILTQLRLDGFSLVYFDGKSRKGKILKPIGSTLLDILEPPKPPEPKLRGGKPTKWFDWMHAMQNQGFKCTLEDVAKKSGYNPNYLRQLHSQYVKSRGIES